MPRPRYPECPLEVDRAHHVVEEFTRHGLPGAVSGLADYTSLREAYAQHPEAAPLTTEQAIAVGRWLHSVSGVIQSQGLVEHSVDPVTGVALIPMGGPHSGERLADVRSQVAGLHFAKEALSDGEREILALAEALLAFIDAEASGGYRR